MREIALYKLQPDYIVGSTDNIDTLSAKISEDDKMLKLIEQDYNSNHEKFKKEYICAMLNYKKNLHLYSWLVLKKYYEEAYMEETVFPNYQMEEMKSYGWMFPQHCINYKIKSSGLYPKTTEELYIEFFDLYFDGLFGFCIGVKDSVIDNYYKQAINCYKNNNYYSCVVSLFPIIEALHQYINRFDKDEFYRIKNNLEKVSNNICQVVDIYAVKVNYYINLVNQFNDLAENHYFKNNVKRKEEPEIINRNRIMHGLFTRVVSKKDCLQLFCTISNLVVIHQIINHNEIYNNTAKEIDELELKLKLLNE